MALWLLWTLLRPQLRHPSRSRSQLLPLLPRLPLPLQASLLASLGPFQANHVLPPTMAP